MFKLIKFVASAVTVLAIMNSMYSEDHPNFATSVVVVAKNAVGVGRVVSNTLNDIGDAANAEAAANSK